MNVGAVFQFSVMLSMLIHVVACMKTLFLLTVTLFHCLDMPYFIYSSPYGHFDFFQFSAILNKIVMNVHGHIFCAHMFLFLLGM